MRILSLSGALKEDLGGPPIVAEQLSYILNKTFVHSLVVFGEVERSFHEQITFRIPFNNRFGFFVFPKIALIRLICKSDLIICHGHYMFFTLFTRIFSSKPIFIIPHGSLDEYGKDKNKYIKSVFNLIICWFNKANTTFVSTHENEKNNIKRNFPDIEVVQLPLGIEIDNDQQIMKNIFKGTSINLGTFSRITEKKRIDLCIESLAIVNSRSIANRFHLHIAGQGTRKLTEGLENLSFLLSVSEQVHFTGWISREAKIDFLKNLDVFLLPSESENYAIAVAEAISIGVPVLVSKNVALSDFVYRHRCGIVIESLDSESVANGILSILGNYSSFSQNCLKARHELDWQHNIAPWIESIVRVIRNANE